MMKCYGKVLIRWLGSSCFEAVLPNGIRILTDPHTGVDAWPMERIDYVLLSHAHPEQTAGLKGISERFGAKIICGVRSMTDLAKVLDLPLFDLISVTPGAAVHLKDLVLYTARAKHMQAPSAAQIQTMTPGQVRLADFGSTESVDYLIRTGNNFKLLFAFGDSRLRNSLSLAEQESPDLVLRACDLRAPYQETAKMLAAYGAQFIVPFYSAPQGMTKESAEEYLHQAGAQLHTLQPTATLLPLETGKWYAIGMAITEARLENSL